MKMEQRPEDSYRKHFNFDPGDIIIQTIRFKQLEWVRTRGSKNPYNIHGN